MTLSNSHLFQQGQKAKSICFCLFGTLFQFNQIDSESHFVPLVGALESFSDRGQDEMLCGWGKYGRLAASGKSPNAWQSQAPAPEQRSGPKEQGCYCHDQDGSAITAHLNTGGHRSALWVPHLKECTTHTHKNVEHSCPCNADRTAWTIPSFLVGQAPPVDGKDR